MKAQSQCVKGDYKHRKPNYSEFDAISPHNFSCPSVTCRANKFDREECKYVTDFSPKGDGRKEVSVR